MLVSGRVNVWRLYIEGVAPLPQWELQPGPTPTGVYGLPIQEGFHQLPVREQEPTPIVYSVETSQGPPSYPGSSEGPFPSTFGTSSSGTAVKASSSESTVKGTMSLTLSVPGRQETATATLEGSLTLSTPGQEEGEGKKVGEMKDRKCCFMFLWLSKSSNSWGHMIARFPAWSFESQNRLLPLEPPKNTLVV